MGPTLEGYVTFIRTVAGIDAIALPDNSPAITTSYGAALEIVNLSIGMVSSMMYPAAVYNLGVDLLIHWAPDVDGSTYFADARKAYGTYNFVAGVLSGSHDESTGQTINNPDFFKGMQMSDLSNLKTPFGRAYLAIAQWYGPTIWGVS